jgi:hypothetical protein
VLPFGKNFPAAGWIGSNKYGFARLLPYLAVHLRGIIHDNLNELQPDKVENSKKVCLGICRLVQSMFAMVSRVMHCSPSRSIAMELDKKLFLSDSVWLQSTYSSSRDKLYIFTTGKLILPSAMVPYILFLLTYLYHPILTGNFLSMLNLAAMIGEFGSPRSFWDGLDEKAIQRVKSMLSNLNLASDTWLATILNHVTREQTLNIIAANMNESPHQAKQNFHSIIGNIRVFASKDIVKETYDSGMVISAVVLKDGDGEMLVVYKADDRRDSPISTQCLTINTQGGRRIEGLWFASLYWQDNAVAAMLTFGTKHELACATRSCVMVMPLDLCYHEVEEDDQMGKLCHVIDVEHSVLDENGWIVSNIYPKDLDQRLGETVDNFGDLEEDDA